MLKSFDDYTDKDGNIWTIETRDFGSGDIDYYLVQPDGTRVSVTRKWRDK